MDKGIEMLAAAAVPAIATSKVNNKANTNRRRIIEINKLMLMLMLMLIDYWVRMVLLLASMNDYAALL